MIINGNLSMYYQRNYSEFTWHQCNNVHTYVLDRNGFRANRNDNNAVTYSSMSFFSNTDMLYQELNWGLKYS